MVVSAEGEATQRRRRAGRRGMIPIGRRRRRSDAADDADVIAVAEEGREGEELRSASAKMRDRKSVV